MKNHQGDDLVSNNDRQRMENLLKDLFAIIKEDDFSNDSRYYELVNIPNFGIWHPSIKKAAELVVIDMWFSGAIEAAIKPADFVGNHLDPRIKVALADSITIFEERLSSAVDSGKLDASGIRRHLDDRLIAEITHISFDQLLKWMDERNLDQGNYIAEWEQGERTISALICDEITFLRNAHMNDAKDLVDIKTQRISAKFGLLGEAQDLDHARALLRAAVAEIFRLRNQLTQSPSAQLADVDKPLRTRQRRTFLTIIAALCDSAGIKYESRGAAQRIKSETERIGAPIDDGTIIKILNEIPDALETRMK